MKPTGHFPTNYSITADASLPSSGGAVTKFKHGRAENAGIGMDGPLLRIEPRNQAPWLAVFARGYPSGDVVDGIFATPNPDVVCVVSEGAGYWVDTIKHSSADVRAFPIRQIEMAADFLIFADFTKLVAYSSGGLAWTSQRIVSDRLRITRVSADLIECIGWDALSGAYIVATLVLQSGKTCSP